MKNSIISLIIFLLCLNVYSQSKLIFARSSGTLNSGKTPNLMLYDVSTKNTSLLYKGSVNKRGEYSVAISPDKSKIITNTYQFSGWKLGIADYKNGEIGKFKRFTSRPNYEYNASWSHNGEFVAYQEFNWSTRDTDIFIADKSGVNTKRVTKIEGGDRTPYWTRDDNSLIFTSGRKDDYEIYVQSIADSNAINITNNKSTDFAPSTSTTEDKIAFLSNREGSVNLYTMDYEGKNLTKLTTNLKSTKISSNGYESNGFWAYQTSWSPDGNYIVFNLMIGSNLEIYTIKKDGTELTRITNNEDSDFCPVWID